MKNVYLFILIISYLAFVLRVLAQIYVAVYAPKWLPKMEQWYSGLLPYYLLLPAQLLIMNFMALITYDWIRGEGTFFVENLGSAKLITGLAGFYFSAMIFRLIVTKMRNPGVKYPRGTIPIVFHCVLAVFVFCCGRLYFMSY